MKVFYARFIHIVFIYSILYDTDRFDRLLIPQRHFFLGRIRFSGTMAVAWM